MKIEWMMLVKTIQQTPQFLPQMANDDPTSGLDAPVSVSTDPPARRVSSRSNKGQTSRYKDYVQSMEASATIKPIEEPSLDSEGEDLTGCKTTGHMELELGLGRSPPELSI